MREQIITIRHPSGTVNLNLPIALEKLSIATQRKFYRLLCENRWADGNEATIEALDVYLPEWSQDCREQWGEASWNFQRDWRDAGYHQGPIERKIIRQSNNRLTRDTKKAKRLFEKSEKILKAWSDTKAKYTR